MKICKTCGEKKDPAEFAKNKRSGDGLSVHCTLCNRIIQRERRARWKEKNPERAKEVVKNACDTYRSKPESKEKIKLQKRTKEDERKARNERLKDSEYAAANNEELRQMAYERFLEQERSRRAREKRKEQMVVEAEKASVLRFCKYCDLEKISIKFKGARCWDCEKKRKQDWAEKRADHVRAQRKLNYWKDAEHAKKQAMRWYEENREYATKRNRNYWHKTKEIRNEKQKEYYEKHRDVQLIKHKLRYLEDPEFRERKKTTVRKWQKSNSGARSVYQNSYNRRPEVKKKNKVRRDTNTAIRNGEIYLPQLCFFCSTTEGPFEIHHMSYDRPDSYLDVVRTCCPCHIAYHEEEKGKELVKKLASTIKNESPPPTNV